MKRAWAPPLSSLGKARPAALWAILSLGLLVTAAAAAQPAAAPQPAGPPNALQGFSQNRGKPIEIQSATLELRDKEKIATFSENVRLVQGDTTLECKKLVVHYGEDATAAAAAGKNGAVAKTASMGSALGGGGPQQIQKLEAIGGIVITQKDQTATGDTGQFDMKSNSVTLTGNVVVTQGQNVLRGDRLWVDLTTGVSRVESGTPGGGGRVQGLFLPSSGQGLKPAPERAAPASNAKGGASRPAPNAAAGTGSAASPATTGSTGSTRPAAGSAPKPAASRPAASGN